MNKIPCTVITKEQYESELRDSLLSMGYKESNFMFFDSKYCLLILNSFGDFGSMRVSTGFQLSKSNKRELIFYDKDIFLEEASRYMLEYKEINKNEIVMKKSELKIGQVLEIETSVENYLFILLPNAAGEYYFYNSHFCISFNAIDNDLLFTHGTMKILKVYDRANDIINSYDISITDRNLLWACDNAKEITMKEIADKFQIPIDKLRIRK